MAGGGGTVVNVVSVGDGVALAAKATTEVAAEATAASATELA